MWASLGRDLYAYLMSRVHDMRDVIRFARTCRALYERLKAHPVLGPRALYHVVRLTDVAQLERVVPERSGVHFCVPSESYAFDMLATLLWYRHQFNAFRVYDGRDATDFINLITRSNRVFALENTSSIADADGNVIRVSNHYGSGQFPDIPAGFQRDVDIEHMQWMQRELFPDTFDWQLIHFPFVQFGPRYGLRDIPNFTTEFHRTTCVRFVFRSGTCVTAPDVKLLKVLRKLASYGAYSSKRTELRQRKRVRVDVFVDLSKRPATSKEQLLAARLRNQ